MTGPLVATVGQKGLTGLKVASEKGDDSLANAFSGSDLKIKQTARRTGGRLSRK